jgi:asparagine synthase (glutamine-hydrolysing)
LENIESICSKIRDLLEDAVKRNLTEGILLSGGLDTSILAVIASQFKSLKAVTVALKDAPAPDVEYACLMAKKLGLEHNVHIFEEDELYEAISVVVETMKSFDPMEIRNSAAIYIGLRVANENEISTIMTGDASDELFAGYSFLFGLEKKKIDLNLEKMWTGMSFSSIPLASLIGMEARLPYLDPAFKDFAVKLDSRYKIQRKDRQVHGKWILRKAYEGVLPKEIAWRVKMPIECGSGTTTLPQLLDQKITDVEFEDKRRKYLVEDEVIVRDKEHLAYYEFYRSLIGVPHPIDLEGKICPECNSNVPEGAHHCRTCGAYPI